MGLEPMLGDGVGPSAIRRGVAVLVRGGPTIAVGATTGVPTGVRMLPGSQGMVIASGRSGRRGVLWESVSISDSGSTWENMLASTRHWAAGLTASCAVIRRQIAPKSITRSSISILRLF